MKKKIGVPLLLISLAFASCSKSHNDTSASPANQTTNSIASNVSAGTWAITNFNQKTEDKTSLFNGYIFSFLSGGVLKAEKNGVTSTGSWTLASAVTYYGVTTPVKSSFTINLGSSVPLNKITKTWNIDSTNTNANKLALVSPEPVEGMHLNFTKQ